MNTYSIISPSLEGVICDDRMYFEGILKPQEFFILRDGGNITENGIEILEAYFNDIHSLFLKKLEDFSLGFCDDENTLKLQALLQEMIKVRKLIENADKGDIIEK
jgi:hypothetical protein